MSLFENTMSAVTEAPVSGGAGIELPELKQDDLTTLGEGWIVTVFDNNKNSYDEVMSVLMHATCCTSEEAYIEAWEVDHYGKCIVHTACQTECETAANVIATIGIKVEATPCD